DRGRAGEQRREIGERGALDRPPRQPVLGHTIARPGVAHLAPQLVDLFHRQAGLVRHDDANRIREILVQHRGYLLLLRSIHQPSPNSAPLPTGAGPLPPVPTDRAPHLATTTAPRDFGPAA